MAADSSWGIGPDGKSAAPSFQEVTYRQVGSCVPYNKRGCGLGKSQGSSRIRYNIFILEVVIMRKIFYVGIDVAKRRHQACVIDTGGAVVVKPFSFENSTAGFDKFLRIVKTATGRCQRMVGLEATGHYWLCLHDALVRHGFNPVVFNPLQTKAFSNLEIRKVKSDSVDAVHIAQALRFGRYRRAHVPSDPAVRELRRLTRLRYFLVDMRTMMLERTTAGLDVVFPEYETLFNSFFLRSSMQLLARYPTPQAMLDAGPQQITDLLKSASRGRFGHQKAQTILECAAASFGVTTQNGAHAVEIQAGVAMMESFSAQIASLETMILSSLETTPQYITTITGVGNISAATIIAEIGDISRFPSGKQLVAFAGLDPSVYQTGEFLGTRSHISKRGSAYLRRALYQCAVPACQFNKDLHAFFQKKISEGKHFNTAALAVAAKLCHIIWRIMTDNRPYQP